MPPASVALGQLLIPCIPCPTEACPLFLGDSAVIRWAEG